MRNPTLLLALALAGCGSVASVDPPAGAGHPPPAPSSSATPTNPPSEPKHFGSVGLVSDAISLFGYASFDTPNDTKSTDSCTLLPATSADERSKNAGNIVVDAASGRLTIAYDAATMVYEQGSLDADDRDATAPIHVHAPGTADVPAFDATVQPAENVSITSPSDVVLSRTSDDIVVTWSASKNEYVALDLVVGDAAVVCRFPAQAQRGTIPKSLVQQAVAQHLDSGMKCNGGTVCAFVSVESLKATSVVVGDWRFFVSHAVATAIPATVQP